MEIFFLQHIQHRVLMSKLEYSEFMLELSALATVSWSCLCLHTLSSLAPRVLFCHPAGARFLVALTVGGRSPLLFLINFLPIRSCRSCFSNAPP
jgi:hypothetical protein